MGRWIAVSLGVFVVLGSLILVGWMHVQGRKDSRRAFENQAQANARFVEESGFPLKGRLERELSEVLNMEVTFAESPESQLAAGFEQVQVELAGGGWMVFVRSQEGFWQQFWRRSMWVPLGLFWGLCLVLAWAISRRVVRPLVALSERIPAIEAGEGNIPEVGRADEIGHLARTLVNERERREAAERLALLGKMATGLAHEIKNPVAAIQMHAQLLGDHGGESAEMIIEEGRRIEGLVNQWLFLAKPEPPQMRDQDLGVCLAGVLDSVAPLADHAGVRIVRDFEREACRLEIDADRMAQVFRNLAMNAIHAMPGGGELRVQIEDRSVIFSDTGGGFSEEALARWGELFFSTKEGGMGIGLSVAAEIVRAHGGELEVANGERGAEVSVIFSK